MPTEIEHKYLVDSDKWAQVKPEKSLKIVQGYLLLDPDKTIRIRTAGERGYITIKGKATFTSRPEFEYKIPFVEAHEMLDMFCELRIEKTRYYVPHDQHTWEVDVFEGENKGLIIAEIELKEESEDYLKPDWVKENVTKEKRYSNANLVQNPFISW